MAGNGSGSQASNVANRLTRLAATFRAVRMEHLFAGITGGVVSTLILHPLDLLKIRFAGKLVVFYKTNRSTLNEKYSYVLISH